MSIVINSVIGKSIGGNRNQATRGKVIPVASGNTKIYDEVIGGYIPGQMKGRRNCPGSGYQNIYLMFFCKPMAVGMPMANSFETNVPASTCVASTRRILVMFLCSPYLSLNNRSPKMLNCLHELGGFILAHQNYKKCITLNLRV